MIVIDNVEINPNPVKTGEVFVIKVSARKEMADWGDTKLSKWQTFINKTWEMLKRKIF